MEIYNNNINMLVDFASQLEYSQHCYITKKQEGFTLTTNKTHLQDLKGLIHTILSSDQLLDIRQQRQVHAAWDMLENYLNKKITGLFSFLIRKEEKARIQEMMQEIEEAKSQMATPLLPTSEGESRLKFYADLPQTLSVKKAATNDLEGINAVSHKIWEKCQNYTDYEKHMTLFFEGEHLLFEEKDEESGDHYEFYNELRDSKMGAYIRGSSHYDRGTTNGKVGGPAPTQQEIEKGVVENPQYEISGPQVKALLFGRVKLALDSDEKPIFGKTFKQVCEEAKANNQPLPTKSKNYTFMQTEWAPDSEFIFKANYWKHRIFSFGLYVGRKILGFSKPNVGPYGYGHADKGKDENSNPTLIKNES